MKGMSNRARLSRFLLDPFVLIAYIVIVGFILLFILYPMFRAILETLYTERGFSLEIYGKLLSEHLFITSFKNTLMITVLSTTTAVLLGYLFAYAITRTDIPGKTLFKYVILIQLISPPFVTGMAFIMLFGRYGLITYGLFKKPFEIYGWHGLWAVQTLTFFPYAYLVLVGVLKSIDPTLEYAARVLGASDLRVFRDIVLPLSMPGVAAAMVVVAMNVLTDFGNPLLIGGNFVVLPVLAFMRVQGWGDYIGATAICVFLLIPVTILFILQRILLGERAYVTVTGAPTGLTIKPLPKFVKYTIFSILLAVSILILMVYGCIFFGAFTKTWGVDYTLTLRNFELIYHGGLDCLKNSVIFAVSAAVITAFLGLLAAYLVIRKNVPGKRFIEVFSMLPFAVPGTFIGLAYILAFHGAPFYLTGTALIIVLNHIMRRIPLAFQSSAACLLQIDPSIEEASATLGADSFRTFVKTALPLLYPAFAAGFIYTFIKCMNTVSAVIFLETPATRLLSTYILSTGTHGYWGQASALATILIATVIGSLVLIRVITGKRVKIFEELL